MGDDYDTITIDTRRSAPWNSNIRFPQTAQRICVVMKKERAIMPTKKTAETKETAPLTPEVNEAAPKAAEKKAAEKKPAAKKPAAKKAAPKKDKAAEKVAEAPVQPAEQPVEAPAAPAAPAMPEPRRSVAFIGSECYPSSRPAAWAT